MPRFFFHMREDELIPDPDGIDYPDAGGARTAAVEGARGIICDQVRRGRLCLRHSIEVADESGACLFTLRFDEAIEVES